MSNFEQILQYGAMGIIIGWFMWRDATYMKEFTNAVEGLRRAIKVVNMGKYKEGE